MNKIQFDIEIAKRTEQKLMHQHPPTEAAGWLNENRVYMWTP